MSGTVDIDALSDPSKLAAADHIRAIRMHPETIAALREHVPSQGPTLPGWGPPPALGIPIIADPTVPVGEWEVDR